MSGITSGVGVFSGIDRNSIIEQLLAIDARPKRTFQGRITQLQGLQTALLDINSKLSALRTSAASFNLRRVFESSAATSSDEDVLTATASPGTAAGTYSFVVDRLVTTQQQLSRGFADSNATAVGASAFTFEPAAARLDSNTRLATLNGGAGVVRGRVVVTDSTGAQTTVDLSRVETAAELVRTFNDALGGRASLSISGDRFKLSNASGTGNISITDATGTTGTAASLGFSSTTSTASSTTGSITATQTNKLGSGTTLRTLNDGLGVFITQIAGTSTTPDFTITTRDGTQINIDIGDIYDSNGARTSTAVADIGGVIERINGQANGKVTASINSSGTGLQLVDNTTGATAFAVTETTNGNITGTTAADLGILGAATGGAGTITGKRLIAGINSTLVRNVYGGRGVGTGQFNATARDGTVLSFTLNADASINDLITQVATASTVAGNQKFSLELAANGRGFVLRDLTGGTGPLSVDGEGAQALGLFADESSSSTVTGYSAQHKFIGSQTLLSSLNGGRGIGTGQFTITDSAGSNRTITISASATTVGDVISTINSSQGSPLVRARINDNGDGILLEEVIPSGGTAGARAIAVRDASGSVARLLGLAKDAAGTGSSNKIDGSFERTVTFSSTDTLQQVTEKINQAGVGVTAAIIADGSSAAPFRLSLTSRNSGEGGRYILETNGLDLGLNTLAEGENARVFYGSPDPARGVLLTSTTNSIGGIAGGLTIEAKAASTTPVTISVATATEAIGTAVDEFVKAFNEVNGRITSLSRYDSASNRRGALLGESTTSILRSELVTTVLQPATGASGRYQSLLDVGFSFDRAGNLQVDKAKLNAAIADDPRGVRDLVAGRAQGATTTTQSVNDANGNPIQGVTVTVNIPGGFTQLGVAEKLAILVDKYIKPIDGVLTRRGRTLDDQVKAQNDRITALDKRLESRRASLERQFIAMESSIGRLQSQQGSLGSIRSIV